MRRVNDSVETVNAAATAIVTAESRVQPVSDEKRRWRIRWREYWCFGSHKHGKRIGHATLVPEPTVGGTAASGTENVSSSTSVVLPFVAPPSSPASFLQSDPPSSTQSPAGILSFASLSANVYSPGPKSIFAIGPYANEPQLVSPPVFSTFTTEPSTAPVTPPPESRLQTTPSSPEVPFAQLLTSSLESSSRRSSVAGQRFPPSHYEFQSYYLYPGSPVGHLISPSSVISNSGTASPFVDQEFASSKHPFLEFRTGEPPKLWSIEGFASRKWGPNQGSGSLTPDATGPASRDGFLLENQISEVASLANSENGSQKNDMIVDHRVSFELTARDVTNCLEKHPLVYEESITESWSDKVVAGTTRERDEHLREENTSKYQVGNASGAETNNSSEYDNEGPLYKDGQEPVLTAMGSVKEFKFVNADEELSDNPRVSADWWTKEKVTAKESVPHSWSFFPMIQPGIS